MSKGNRIVLTPDRGWPVEGYLQSGQTVSPGMVMQYDPTQALIGNRQAWKIYVPGADGGAPAGPYIILREDFLQGKTMTDAYGTAVGTHLFGWIPLPGCELNVLYLDIAGTADDHAAGELGIVKNNSGKFIATTGSPASQPVMLMETVTDPIADFLGWVIWR